MDDVIDFICFILSCILIWFIFSQAHKGHEGSQKAAFEIRKYLDSK